MIIPKLTFFLNGAALMLFLIAAIQMFFRARKNRSRPHLLFAVCLSWMVMIEVKEVVLQSLYLSYNVEVLGPWFTLPDLFTLLLVALFFFELVMPGRVTLRYALRFIAPFALLSLWCVVSAAMLDTRPVYTSPEEIMEALPASYPLSLVVYVLYTIGFCIYATTRVAIYSRRYAAEIAHAYSFTERIHLRWMRWMSSIMAFYLISYIAIIALTTTEIYTLYTFVITLIAWGILYACVAQYRIPQIIENYWQEPSEPEPAEEISVSEVQRRTEQLRQQVEEAINERQLYLNPDLTIIDMATECGTNRTHLSQFFNNVLGMPFRDYINRCRIEHAVHMMSERSYKIEELAMLAGFGSTTTFYRAFAKEKGMTPQRWYEQHPPMA